MNDVVKIIFEKLNLEPNERFKIKNSDSEYLIKENLDIVCVKLPADYEFKLQGLLNGDIEIIKLPKEPTFIELMNWKPNYNETYHYVDSCNHVKTNRNECWVIDEQIIEHNKPYPTREMATKSKEIQEKYQELGHQFTIQEWQDGSIIKYSLYINHQRQCVDVMSHIHTQDGKYTFKTKEDREKFINFLGSTEQEQYESVCLYL